ncbi:MAG: hypothetical protein ABIF01_02465 [Candidatus Micrarchaeota archaeon]
MKEFLMDEALGKLVWTDDAPKSPAWKTALLLFVVIFSMNFATSQSTLYLALALISAGLFLYFTVRTAEVIGRTKVYEDGILAPTKLDGSILPAQVEKFFPWVKIKSLRMETKGIFSKSHFLLIEYEEKTHSVSLRKKDGFMDACKKLGKEVS